MRRKILLLIICITLPHLTKSDDSFNELKQEIHALDDKISIVLTELKQLRLCLQALIGKSSDPFNLDALHYQDMIKKGLQFFTAHNYQAATTIFNTIIQQCSDPHYKAFSHFQLALLAHQRNDITQAEHHYKAALTYNFNNQIQASAQFNLGLLYQQQNLIDQAQTFYQLATEQNYDLIIRAKAALNNALTYHRADNNQQAHYYYEKAYNQDVDLPTKMIAAYNYAQLLVQEHNVARALELLRVAAQQEMNREIKTKASQLLKKIIEVIKRAKK